MPLLLLVLTATSVVCYGRGGEIVWALASLMLAALFAWRLSFHATMWDVTEYGGCYTPEAEMKVARRRYRIWLSASSVVTLSAVTLFLYFFR